MRERKVTILVVFLLISSLMFSQVKAEEALVNQYDYAVKSACKWLGDNQNEDGSWSSNEMPFVTPEIVKVLKNHGYLQLNCLKGIDWLKANRPLSYDFLARYQSIEEISSEGAISELIENQNDDGGWGISEGFDSTIIDTAIIFSALLKNNGYDDELQKAASYLVLNQNSDGSWGYYCKEQGNVYVTGTIRKVLFDYQTRTRIDLSEVIKKSGDWLVENKNLKGSWGDTDDSSDNIFLSCIAYKGLVFDRRDDVKNIPIHMLSLQQPDGSWGNDAYLTALAIDVISQSIAQEKVELKDVKLYVDGKESNVANAKSYIEIYPIFSGLDLTVDVYIINNAKEKFHVHQDSIGRYLWNVGMSESGKYNVEVVLKDTEGKEKAKMEKSFDVLPYLDINQAYLEVTPGASQLYRPVLPSVKLFVDGEANTEEGLSVSYSVYKSDGDYIMSKDVLFEMGQGDGYIELGTFDVDSTSPCEYTISAEIKYNNSKVESRTSNFKVLEQISSIYTLDQDFDRGTITGVNHEDTADQLQLNKSAVVFPYIWIANAAEGTLSKLDTRTGREIARYRTGPNSYSDPSRTAVDKDGNCWVANRGNGTVLKVAMFEGVDRNGNGKIDTCTDLNGNGIIEESEILAWGQDEAILAVTNVGGSGSGPRGVALDKKGRVWVGLYNEKRYMVLDSEGKDTGISVSVNAQPYGAVIDSKGILWSSGRPSNCIEKLDTNTDKYLKSYNVGGDLYGIVVDKSGIVWTPLYSGTALIRFDPITESYTRHLGTGANGRGVAVDNDGNVWVAYSGNHKLNKFDKDGNFLLSVDINPIGYGPIGVGVDGEGYIWTVNQTTNNATKVTTEGKIIGYYPVGRGPYTYSDMTGYNLKNFTTHEGIWSVTHDGGIDGYTWSSINWNEKKPEGTDIQVKARAADTIESLEDKLYLDISNGQETVDLKGRFLQAEVKFITSDTNTPVLEDIQFIGENRIPIADAGEDQIVRLMSEGGTKVILNGTRSYDPDGDSLEYRWKWDNGEAKGSQPEVLMKEGMTEIKLTVSDGKAESEIDTVKVTVVGPDSFTTSIVSDKAGYLPNETVTAAVYGINSSNIPRTLDLTVSIIDSNGRVMYTIEKDGNFEFGEDESKELNYSWNCGNTLSGDYAIRAVWLENGRVAAFAEHKFKILPSGKVRNKVRTDKISYRAGENANITNTVISSGRNMVMKDLRVKTLIQNNSGNVVWNNETYIGELLPQEIEQYNVLCNTGKFEPGEYTVTSAVYETVTSSGDGIGMLCVDMTSLQIEEAVFDGYGMTGDLEVLTREVETTEDVVFKCQLTNLSNSEINGISSIINIVDPITGESIAYIRNSADLKVGSPYLKEVTWKHERIDPGIYFVVYSAQLQNGTILPLDSSYFKVLPEEMLTNTLITDKAQYYTGDDVKITDSVYNYSTNSDLDNLVLKTFITDKDGKIIWENESDINELKRGQRMDIGRIWSTSGVKAGGYNIISQVLVKVDAGSTESGHLYRKLSEDLVTVRIIAKAVNPPSGGGSSGGKGSGSNDSGGKIEEPKEEKPVAVPVDIAVSISADKSSYVKGQIITYTIKYRNKLGTPSNEFEIAANIPEYTSVSDKGEGEVRDGRIVWKIPSLPAKGQGQKVYKVIVEDLDKSEVLVSCTAAVESKENLINTEDDKSTITVMLRSKDKEKVVHIAYIKGYPDKTFGADREITRAEVAAMFAKLLGLDTKDSAKSYNDVEPEHWASGVINAVTKHGIFKGYEDGTFRPDAAITRAELAVVAAKYLKLEDIKPFEVHYTDIEGHWACNFIEEINRHNIIKGYKDGTFRPDAKIKRSETVTLMNNMLYRGPLKVEDSSFTDVLTSHWAFGQIEEAAREHELKLDESGNEIYNIDSRGTDNAE